MNRDEAIKHLETYSTTNGSGQTTQAQHEEAKRMAIKALKQEPKILNTLDFAIDASNGDTNYFVGFRNGLRYSKSLIDGKEPQFENCTEQEPKTGRWVENDRGISICSCCGKDKYEDIDGSIYDDVWFPNYCPNCGAKMVEPQESEKV